MPDDELEAVPRDALLIDAEKLRKDKNAPRPEDLTAEGLELKRLTDQDKTSGTALPANWWDYSFSETCFALRVPEGAFFALVS